MSEACERTKGVVGPIPGPGNGQTLLGPDQRAAAWVRLGSEQFDVVVIGGGVVGAGAALDAATRGLKVALVEACLLYTSPSPRDRS